MDTDEHGPGRRGIRLGSLLVLSPLLALVVAFGSWIHSLRRTVTLLEQRVATLEMNQPLTTMMDVSDVGVPFDVDHGMQIDSFATPVAH